MDWIREFSDTIKLVSMHALPTFDHSAAESFVIQSVACIANAGVVALAVQEDHQRVNHFRNHYELTRKDLLVKNVKRMRKQLERMEDHEEAAAYNFVPESFVLPGDYALFVEAFKRASGTWIMKPVGGAQGRGIFLITKLSQIAQWRKDHTWKSDGPRVDSYIVQRYVDRPYTVGSKKFDCRLYALVTSYTPLTVWFHRSGFARFSSARYDRAAGTDALRKFSGPHRPHRLFCRSDT